MKCYAMWRLKDGIKIAKKDLSYFSPGGFTFTHESGQKVCFDFLNSYTNYEWLNRIIDSTLTVLDHDHVTDCLKEYGGESLIKEEYNLDLFKNGKVDFSNEDEMFCLIDLMINGELVPEVDFNEYVEPIYLAVLQYNEKTYKDERVELYNKLTEKEYKEYISLEA